MQRSVAGSLIVTVALIGARPVIAVEAAYSGNYVSIAGGASLAIDRVGRFLEYETAQGSSVGAELAINPYPKLIAELDYGRDQASLQDLDITRQQASAAIGYLGTIGRNSTWRLEAVYSHLVFQTSSSSLCAGHCLTQQHDGVGVQGGFNWPLSEQWQVRLQAGYVSLAAHEGFDALGETLVNASVDYRLASSWSVGVRAEYLAYFDRNDNALEQDFASWRAYVSYHF